MLAVIRLRNPHQAANRRIMARMSSSGQKNPLRDGKRVSSILRHRSVEQRYKIRSGLLLILLTELLDTTFRIHNPDGSRIKRMAVRTNFHSDPRRSRLRNEFVSAVADHFTSFVFRVDSGFHWFILSKNSWFVFVFFILSRRNSIASILDKGASNFLKTHTRWRTLGARSNSSLRVPDLLMSMAG